MSERGFIAEDIDINRSGTMQDITLEEGKKVAAGRKYQRCIVTVEMVSTGDVSGLSDEELIHRIAKRLDGVI